MSLSFRESAPGWSIPLPSIPSLVPTTSSVSLPPTISSVEDGSVCPVPPEPASTSTLRFSRSFCTHPVQLFRSVSGTPREPQPLFPLPLRTCLLSLLRTASAVAPEESRSAAAIRTTSVPASLSVRSDRTTETSAWFVILNCIERFELSGLLLLQKEVQEVLSSRQSNLPTIPVFVHKSDRESEKT